MTNRTTAVSTKDGEDLLLASSQPSSSSSASSPEIPALYPFRSSHYGSTSSNSSTLLVAPLIKATSRTSPPISLTERYESPSEDDRKRRIRAFLTEDGIVSDGGDEEDDEDEYMLHAKENLLEQALTFDLPYSPDRGFRATSFKFWSVARPHMRAMHASWICFFASYSVQFAMAPLLPQLQVSLNLTKQDIWLSNVWMVVGGVPMRFLLGPLCDTYGPRFVMCTMLLACSIPCALSGVLIFNLPSLLIVRFVIGSMDAFVPSQCWITSQFVRDVTGTIMAIVAGLGASGSAFGQLGVGYLYSMCIGWTGGDPDLAWKLTLVFPAIFALAVTFWAYFYSDDCPLGNFVDVKKAGLMMERSAVDSFRSGAINLNSWLMFLQYAGTHGVDVTMCNGVAIYYHTRFSKSITETGAIAFGYGFSALYARGLGGYVSDKVGKRFSVQGRLWMNFVCMLAQGVMNIWFARTDTLRPSLAILIAFAILVQMSMGTIFSVVPYVDSPNTGSVAGIVGAGGNVGAALLGLLFMYHDYDDALEYMAYLTIGTACLTPLIVIKGYKGMVFGADDHGDADRKQQSPLMVPKLGHSPHFVKLRRKPRP